MTRKTKPPSLGETTPAGQRVRDDWSELCRLIAREHGARLHRQRVPQGLRYLLDEPIRSTLFYCLDPIRAGELWASGRTPGLPFVREHAHLRLVRDWAWRLVAAGCTVAYPFATIGDGGSIFVESRKP